MDKGIKVKSKKKRVKIKLSCLRTKQLKKDDKKLRHINTRGILQEKRRLEKA